MSRDFPSSHRQILRATSIIGGSSLANIVIGLLRMKAAALLLGPVGVGLAGLLQNLMNTAATVAALGFNTAGTRQIADAEGRGTSALRTAERALFLGTAMLALLGAVVFWLLHSQIAEFVLDGSRTVAPTGWLALGIGLTVFAWSQIAFLTGLRRLKDVATVTVLAAVLGTTTGIAALLLLGLPGVVWFVVALPASTALVGAAFVLRVPRTAAPKASVTELGREWRLLLRLGAALATASLLSLGAQLAVRILVQRKLGAHSLGLFQASWAIAMTYVAFVLQAMGTDYYPRLTKTFHDHRAACRLVNDQTEVALFLGGPVLLAIIGTAPWLMHLLYSSKFAGAATLLRWQALGDVAKLASWPLGFVLMASAKGRNFLLAEATAAAALIGLTALVLPMFGLDAAGIGYLASYLAYLVIVFLLARRSIGFAWTRRIVWLISSLSAAGILTMLAADFEPLLGGLLGVGFAAAFFVTGLFVMQRSLPRPLAQMVSAVRGR